MHELRPAILLLLLAIDDVSLPLRKNVCLYLSKPVVRAAPVLEPSPVGTNPPYDGAKFRLWYDACHRGADAGRVDADGGLDCLVQWATEIPSTMRGRLVRVLVTMQKPGDAQSPQLYSIALKARQ